MGMGSSKVYDIDKQGNRYVVRQDWKYNLFKYGGKYYKITGNAWTGFYRNQIDEQEFTKLDKRMRKIWRRDWKNESYLSKTPFNQLSSRLLRDWFGAVVIA